MPRKKMASTAKPKKMQKQTETLAGLEKNFKSMPTQIVAQCRQELTTLKQHEKQLSVATKEAETLATAIQKKCAMLSNGKSNTTTKKQLKAAKQGYIKAMQAIKAMTKELNVISTMKDTVSLKSAKYTAFAKEWSTIEKQLTKKSKPTKKIAISSKPKMKAPKTMRKSKTKMQNQEPTALTHSNDEATTETQSTETA